MPPTASPEMRLVISLSIRCRFNKETEAHVDSIPLQ
jgi:hypothetical protein